MKKYKFHLRSIALTMAGLLALMLFTRPTSLPVIVLIIPFILLFMALLSFWHLLRYATRHVIEVKTPNRESRLGLMVCTSLILLLVLQSLGQLTFRDSVTVLALAVIGYLYLLRSRPITSKK